MPNYLTLTRQDLYDLVWSKPMRALAAEFGISDVALAKRCATVSVPVPPRGYWARIAAGQKPDQPPLPKYRTTDVSPHAPIKAPTAKPQSTAPTRREPIAPDVTVRVLVRDPTPTPPNPDDPNGPPSLSIPGLEPVTRLADAHVITRRTAYALGFAGAKALPFEHGEKTGVILPLHVSPAVLERALLLADTLLRAAEALGWSLEPQPPPEPDRNTYSYRRADPAPEPSRHPHGVFLIEGERVPFQIEERDRIEEREPTAAELSREKREPWYHAPRKHAVLTGKLRVSRLKTGYWSLHQKTWTDRIKKPVERCLPDILAGLRELSLKDRQLRLDEERKAREAAERERLREEQRKRMESHAALIEYLENQAGAWHRARYLRRYLNALKSAAGGKPIHVTLGDAPIDFMAWAEQYIDQLDPLHATPRHADMAPEESSYRSYTPDTEALAKSFARLSGLHWQRTGKLQGTTHSVSEIDDE